MIDQSFALTGTGLNLEMPGQVISQLHQEYLEIQRLFQLQPPQVQRYLEAQAAVIADAILENLPLVRFNLPDQVQLAAARDGKPAVVPAELRQQTVGGMLQAVRQDLRTSLHQSLARLEQSNLPALSTSAALLRYAVAGTLVHNMLPAGRSVTYTTAEADTIPCIPVPSAPGSKSAIQAASDAFVENEQADGEYSELQVPYVEAARRFYLPQWVAFDDRYQLLVGSLNEAEIHIASMQRYLFVLGSAVELSPCLAADEDYQQKRYGILGQLVNQGRALARYHVLEIINTIKSRAAEQDLNRGLHLNLPYFDDQKLSIENYEFDIIPAGRIMFVPAFVVRAAHEQQVKVSQNIQFSPATRKHLLTLLYILGSAFYPADRDRSQHSKG